MEANRTVVPEAPKPGVLVYDIPADETPEETAQIIGQHEGYYLLAAMPWPGVGARVFLRQHALHIRRDAETESPERKREEAEAEAIILRYPKLTPSKIADKLAENGIVRNEVWVGWRRKNLERRATAANARREA